MSTTGLSQKQLLILLGAIPALGGLLVGYNTAVVAGALEFIAKDFSLKDSRARIGSYINSCWRTDWCFSLVVRSQTMLGQRLSHSTSGINLSGRCYWLCSFAQRDHAHRFSEVCWGSLAV